LLERWNKSVALKQEFGNRPVWPTIQNLKIKQYPHWTVPELVRVTVEEGESFSS